MAIDGILNLCINVCSGLVVYPKVIKKHLNEELPFMATENILMDAVKAGGDRQELHEKIRRLSMEAGRAVKEEGKANDLLQRIKEDKSFNLDEDRLAEILNPALYTGCASHQVEKYLKNVIGPILDQNKAMSGDDIGV